MKCALFFKNLKKKRKKERKLKKIFIRHERLSLWVTFRYYRLEAYVDEKYKDSLKNQGKAEQVKKTHSLYTLFLYLYVDEMASWPFQYPD